ncbi:hypothetical protein H6F86_05810 [Phormidium sp. FACHB-592]|uniref:Uncharacterized protein n=1 Tax=Stenomitos frigidus AS-A4 TaxID=2933935 RepID=A0ABV0KTW1_9CYAN|nr:hypothetical protein [Phormidium sp. FACHB-592]
MAIKTSPFLDQGGDERLYSSDKNELTPPKYEQVSVYIFYIHRDLLLLTPFKGI